jgi:prephenate dehydratase
VKPNAGNKRRISFQGELGAFSQVAAQQLAAGDFVPQPLPSFLDVFESVVNGKCDAAVIPIENTLHGSIHDNYDHLLKFNLLIRGETFVRIVHNLIAAPGVRMRDIKQIYSHPVALNQCRHFLDNHREIERATFYDTAGSVKMLMEQRRDDAAAIASETAAQIYGAHILHRSIEDDRQNFTRFFLLTRQDKRAAPAPDKRVRFKTSIAFAVRNIPGVLFRCLSAFALRDLNLTKIESRPIPGKPWEYLFYLDFLGHPDEPAARNALHHLEELADTIRVFGAYPAAVLPSARQKTTAVR